tara:strand:- start:1161 stop:1514 length:354 start_codon:yes stop_codon:yes gene_type:complete
MIITYIKELHLDGILLSLQSQMFIEIKKCKLIKELESLEAFNYHRFSYVFTDYKRLYSRFMSTNYDFILLDQTSHPENPTYFTNLMREAIIGSDALRDEVKDWMLTDLLCLNSALCT